MKRKKQYIDISILIKKECFQKIWKNQGYQSLSIPTPHT